MRDVSAAQSLNASEAARAASSPCDVAFVTPACAQKLPGSRFFCDAARGPFCSVRALAPLKTVSPSNPSCSYGPFNYGGTFTTDSNRRFDGWLKTRNAASGIRDFEAVSGAALQVSGSASLPNLFCRPVLREGPSATVRSYRFFSPCALTPYTHSLSFSLSHLQNGFELIVDFDMPANNRLLVFVLSDATRSSAQLHRIPQ